MQLVVEQRLAIAAARLAQVVVLGPESIIIEFLVSFILELLA